MAAMANGENGNTSTKGEFGENGIRSDSENPTDSNIIPSYKTDLDREIGVDQNQSDGKLAEIAWTDPPNNIGGADEIPDDEEEPGFVTRTWRRYRPIGHTIVWIIVTA